jgi:NYN domain
VHGEILHLSQVFGHPKTNSPQDRIRLLFAATRGFLVAATGSAGMTDTRRVALFIDVENIAHTHADQILKEGRKLGRLTVARCYGKSAKLEEWAPARTKHHLVARLTLAGSDKPNASDFAMTIDVVSLLHQQMFDVAILVSSDRDFTQLAVHIREQGVSVYGIGESKTSAGLRDAYEKFFPLNTKKAAAKPAVPAPHEHEKKVMDTYKELQKAGPVSVKKFAEEFRAMWPEVNLGKGGGKAKRLLLATGMMVDDKQIVTRG